MSEPAAIKLIWRVRETGSSEPARIGGYRKPLLAGHEESLRELTPSKPGITLVETHARRRGGLPGHELVDPAQARAVAQKTARGRLSRTARTWPSTVGCGELGSASWTQTVSCSWTKPGQARTWYGGMAGRRAASAWSMPPRLHAAVRHVRAGDRAKPDGHWRTTTFVAGLRSTGLRHRSCRTARVFLACVEQFLAPALRPGDVVVMDNLGAHKVAGVAEAIRVAGAGVLCLPPHPT